MAKAMATINKNMTPKPDASNTNEDEVNKVITEIIEAGAEDENANKDDPKDDENNKGKLKEKGPYQFENNSLAHRANENARKMGQLHAMKHEVSALV